MRNDRIMLFFAVNYFAQGMSGIVYEPVSYLLKDGLRLTAGQAAGFIGWMTVPFLVKPLFGLLTDLFPILGRLRRPHLILGAALGAACWLALALRSVHSYGPLLALLILVNVSVVFCDVVVDGVMVEQGKAQGKTGYYQAVQIGTLYAALVLTGLGGGWLAARAAPRTVFALAALFPLLIAFSSCWIKEMPKRVSTRAGLNNLLRLLAGKRFWCLCLMIFLWNFSPFLGTVQFYYQSETLRLSPIFIGILSTLGGVTGALGALGFGLLVRKWGTEAFIRRGVLLGGAMGFLYLLYRGPVSAAIITVILGFFGVFFRLGIMDLAAQSCPQGAEATAFAIYMAVFNVAALASNTIGGKLYDHFCGFFHELPSPEYGAAAVLIVVGAACTLSCWWLLPLVRIEKGQIS